MRLIDIDDAIEKAIESDKVVGSEIWETSEVVEYLEGLPTVDAVEVVRCKDCASYGTDGCADGFGWCALHDRGKMDFDFCSCGGRRDKDGV